MVWLFWICKLLSLALQPDFLKKKQTIPDKVFMVARANVETKFTAGS